MKEKKFQRRTVLVKRTLQLKYIALIFVSVLVAALVVGGDIYYTMARIILNENPSLQPVLSQVNSMVLVKLTLYLGIILLISLFISHRFAGPIYRFEKSAQAVASGDLTHRVHLRTGDELAELQDEFNTMVASLQALVQKDRNLIHRLSAKLSHVLGRLPDHGARSVELTSLEGELAAVKKELEHLTSHFEV